MDAFIVLEDKARDYESLAAILAEIEPSAHVERTEDIDGLYQTLGRITARSRTMVFTDISLGDAGDSIGLDCLAGLAEAFPVVPFAIVTGYFSDNIAAATRDYFYDPQIVGVLDKSNYSDIDVAETVVRGDDYVETSLQRMANERTLLERAAARPEDPLLREYTDAIAMPGVRKASRRSQDRMVIRTVLGGVYRSVRIRDSAVDDLVGLLGANPEWFQAAVRALSSLESADQADHPRKKIESCERVWEVRGGRDIRVYFQMDDQNVDVLRIAPKREQGQVIRWLNSN